jgi:HSP20 family protein
MTYYLTTPYGRWMNHRRMMNRWLEENALDDLTDRVTFPMDLKAEQDGYVVTALLPGVSSDDLNITITNDVLTIQGELKNDYDENATYVFQERPSGRFYRAINLPESVDSTKVEASLTNGVLTLRIPKAEEAKPKSIKVVAK